LIGLAWLLPWLACGGLSALSGQRGAGCASIGSGTTRVVLLSAGLPCGARGKVGPSNSLRALRALRSNNSGQFVDEARCACPPCRCAPRHPRGARADAGFALCAPLWACGEGGALGGSTFVFAWFRLVGLKSEVQHPTMLNRSMDLWPKPFQRPLDDVQAFERDPGMSASGAWELSAKRAQNSRSAQ